MDIKYEIDKPITSEQFIDILKRSTLGDRRPIDDPRAIQAMLDNGNLTVTAWDGDKLVGISRSLTDFEWCCYLSDLAVDSDYQKKGIGKELMRLTQSKLGDKATVILLAAPKAKDYYPHIGYMEHDSAWTIQSRERIN